MLQSMGLQRAGHDLVTEQQKYIQQQVNRGEHRKILLLGLFGELQFSKSK